MLDFEDSKNVVHKMHNLLVLIYFFEIYYDVCSGLKYLLQPCSNCINFFRKKVEKKKKHVKGWKLNKSLLSL